MVPFLWLYYFLASFPRRDSSSQSRSIVLLQPPRRLLRVLFPLSDPRHALVFLSYLILADVFPGDLLIPFLCLISFPSSCFFFLPLSPQKSASSIFMLLSCPNYLNFLLLFLFLHVLPFPLPSTFSFSSLYLISLFYFIFYFPPRCSFFSFPLLY